MPITQLTRRKSIAGRRLRVCGKMDRLLRLGAEAIAAQRVIAIVQEQQWPNRLFHRGRRVCARRRRPHRVKDRASFDVLLFDELLA
jgi:hypothetical protein